MKIGTDVSLQTCRDEGYMVIEFAVRELYPNGRKNGIDKEHCVNFTKSYPDYIRKEMGWSPGDSMILLDVDYSWNDLIEIYQKHKKGIDSMIGASYDVENIEPTEYDILNLGSDIDAYCGLDY
jgi:hypothetical protein